jgi:hypothetical protein
MIIVKLTGGLGNQLFQFAAAKSLALHLKQPFKLDVSSYKTDILRDFELSFFNANFEVAAAEEINSFTQQSFLGKLLQHLKPSYKRKIYKEPFYHYDENFFNALPNVYLKGYWQSHKYFLPFHTIIEKDFSVKKDFIQNVETAVSQLENEVNVSVHIRRSDYANKITNNFHGVLPEAYYNAAIASIKNKYANAKFYFFSDDIDWVQKNINTSDNFEFVTGKITSAAIEDFCLMQHCSHNIIANSSFSWWAAYLNPNPDKIVIAPKRWFNKAPYDTKDLIPESWIRL